MAGFVFKKYSCKLKKEEMEGKRFQKRKEDFVCKKCGEKVRGSGYTDHCPRCLWSRHVDINPGDRGADCRGMMEPERAEVSADNINIYYRCLACDYRHKVKADPKDNKEKIIDISKNEGHEKNKRKSKRKT